MSSDTFPNTTPVIPLHTQESHLLDEVGSPITPFHLPRGQPDIDAIPDLVYAIGIGRRIYYGLNEG